jgi:hypothetical protein
MISDSREKADKRSDSIAIIVMTDVTDIVVVKDLLK